MPDEVPMVTSCPLCLAPDEVESMVTVQIERAIPKGRAAIMICRNCAGAVIRACDGLDPPLVDPKVFQLIARAEAPAECEPSEPEDTLDVAPEGIDPMREMGFTEVFPCPDECQLGQAGVPHFHTARAKEAYPCPSGCDLQKMGVEHTHTRKEWENG